MNLFSLKEIVDHGEPIISNRKVQDSVLAIPILTKLVHGIVKTFNQSFVEDFLGIKKQNMFSR
jgi:hypothetical protein